MGLNREIGGECFFFTTLKREFLRTDRGFKTIIGAINFKKERSRFLWWWNNTSCPVRCRLNIMVLMIQKLQPTHFNNILTLWMLLLDKASHEVTPEDDVDMSGNENQRTHVEDTSLLQQNVTSSKEETQQVEKKNRGPTQMKNLNEVIGPIEVKFNEMGQSLFVTLSPFLARLVRETAPYTLVDGDTFQMI
ncbi:Hypothetical predicted protein [Olea europaea subsp. europaea]|uniref:Uncharacterized protein n=1 Tax=Olea europaea subsp. europaea TaxID=158383 RepID=A0A8S0PXE4_OLEEU|nr:Hypothetical predicted protein [Olea europaea subsp. europaea]